VPVETRRFLRSDAVTGYADELARVDQLANQLAVHLAATEARIDVVHQHQAASSVVQVLVSELLREQLNFTEELVIPSEMGLVTRARPDFYFQLADGRGILAEVERGGTTTNNHDLKDMWKAHISPSAQHLFLIVPNANWNEARLPRERPYNRVVQRVASFFGDPRREVDVLSVHVFGYGRADSPWADDAGVDAPA